ncbi:MAG: N-acetyltransferase [Gammaproteobacteria bacterium]|nr:MAG: N-acetyltransferase [Gammaproteobacteria bacterium]
MSDIHPIVSVNKPSALSPTEIQDFVALVLAGGEVMAHGLEDRVKAAAHIAFLREGKCLLGVAGLKLPSQNHRSEVEGGSRAALGAQEYPFELGWVFVLPSARGRKLSLPLCSAVVEAAQGRGIFATSRATNIGMHKTLTKIGFTRVGVEWPSRQNQGQLALFVRNVA